MTARRTAKTEIEEFHAQDNRQPGVEGDAVRSSGGVFAGARQQCSEAEQMLAVVAQLGDGIADIGERQV